MDVGYLVQCDVDRFYGIEYEEFPTQIAQVAMWLIDHQMNQMVSNTFGNYYVRLPLRKNATIAHSNALRTDWQSLIDRLPWEKGRPKYDYILGNPPFIGSKFMSNEQRVDIEDLFKKVKGAGTLDYVSGWYIKAAKYMQEYNFMDQAEGISIEQPLRRTLIQDNNAHLTKTAFVSTNSISQGEQVGMLWNELFNKYKIKIHFAHRTFSWSNEARGNAAVHVVIIGFGNFNVNDKALFEYEHVKAEPHEIKAKNINPYLVEARDVILSSRQKPFDNVPEIGIGNKPIDGGHFLFTQDEKEEFLKKEPKASKYFYKWIGSHEFINGYNRWCLYVGDAQPGDLKSMPEVLKRIDAVRHFRLASTSLPTIKLADTPTKFHVQNIPNSPYLVVPKVSSERRKYIPIGYIDNSVLSSDLLFIIKSSRLYQFGVLASAIHMTWVKYTCGRLKSDFRYSKDIVYNNFPWPENPNEKQEQAVEAAAQNVLDARAQFPNASLADLYDPNTMPPALVKAHQALDKAVDLCYRPQPFVNETKRIEFLFELYDKYTSGMFVEGKRQKK
ncbi:MAG: methyltransferase [Segetibacter sp.]|nr:methyltransferase [Segetibacter sp.]